jgi:hypothetical protein
MGGSAGTGFLSNRSVLLQLLNNNGQLDLAFCTSDNRNHLALDDNRQLIATMQNDAIFDHGLE